MARILIFDSTADGMALGSAGEANAVRSKQFRVCGAVEDVEQYGLELVADGGAVELAFKVEHFDDEPGLHGTAPPSARTDPIVAGFAAPAWNLELTSELQGGGIVKHFQQQHELTLADEVSVKVQDLPCRTYWLRLKVWLVVAQEVAPRVLIWAQAAAHAQLEVLEELETPYAYTDEYVSA